MLYFGEITEKEKDELFIKTVKVSQIMCTHTSSGNLHINY